MSDRRWARPFVVWLLAAAMASGTLFYPLVAVLATFIREDLAITRAQLGWIVSSFSIVAAVLSPITGGIADRIGARQAMLAVFASSSLGFLLLSRSGTLLFVIAAAVVLAVGQAIMNPSTNKMIAREFEPGRRGVITGIKQSGVQAGTLIAGLTFPALALTMGWRGVPLVVGVVIGVVFGLAWFVLPNHQSTQVATPRPTGPLPSGVWWMAAYALAMGLGGSPVFSFLPLYASEALGASESVAGLIVGIPSAFGIVARIGWSMFAERRGDFPRTLRDISLLSVAAASLILVAAPVGIWLLWVASVMVFLSVSAWNSVAMLSVIVGVDSGAAGRATGFVLAGFLTGLAVAPPIFGWSVDRYGTYAPGFTAVVLCFLAASLIMTIWMRHSAGSTSTVDRIS